MESGYINVWKYVLKQNYALLYKLVVSQYVLDKTNKWNIDVVTFSYAYIQMSFLILSFYIVLHIIIFILYILGICHVQPPDSVLCCNFFWFKGVTGNLFSPPIFFSFAVYVCVYWGYLCQQTKVIMDIIIWLWVIVRVGKIYFYLLLLENKDDQRCLFTAVQ